MHELIGTSIGRYHILEQLGQGGMATVYKAYDTRLEREVALKIIRRDALPVEVHTRVFKRFEREAKALAKLNHPNIVKVYDYGEYEGAPYLVMEYIPAGILKQLTGKPLPWVQAAALLVPVAHALEYAHQQKIIHRDVKPSNILIAKSGEPLLSDFGIAKILEGEEGATLTGTNVGVGTPEYMSPEQGLGKEIDARADIYSLGVVFFELVTGRKPYTADTPLAVVLKHHTDPLPHPGEFIPDLPKEVERIIFKALAKKPEDRYASMAEFAAALEKLARTESQKSLHPASPLVDPVPQKAPDLQSEITPSIEATYDGTPTSSAPPQIGNKSMPLWAWGLGGLLLLGITGLGLKGALGAKPALTATRLPVETETPLPVVKKTPLSTLTLIPATSLTPTLGVGSSMIWEKDGMEMMYVPAGEFEMGSNNGGSDEEPVHTVYLDAYWMDKFEVTNEQYQQCVTDGACQSSKYKDNNDFNGSYKPVVGVNWNDAKNYCEWAGRRLPSEAEWEKAARGVDGRIYPWGYEFDCLKGNFDDETFQDSSVIPGGTVCDGYNTTSAVGSFPAGVSPYDVMDMAGNVWEWTADWYGEYYYKKNEQNNPHGPSSGEYRIVRGGSWDNNNPNFVRATDRNWSNPVSWNLSIGFRCAASAAPF